MITTFTQHYHDCRDFQACDTVTTKLYKMQSIFFYKRFCNQDMDLIAWRHQPQLHNIPVRPANLFGDPATSGLWWFACSTSSPPCPSCTATAPSSTSSTPQRGRQTEVSSAVCKWLLVPFSFPSYYVTNNRAYSCRGGRICNY